MAYTAGNVSTRASALLNDVAEALFTFAVKLPYLKIANEELEQELILVGHRLQLTESAVIDVAANAVTLALPSDFFFPIRLQERTDGSTSDSDFVDMVEKDFEPNMERSISLGVWAFRDTGIHFVGATEAREVKLYYWRTLDAIADSSTTMEATHGQNFLAMRTAACCARFIGGNHDLADVLDTKANEALDLLTSLSAKNNQGIRIRRKPFRIGGIRR